MPADLHRAIWRGPFAAELPDMGVIHPGEEHLVSVEDLKSAHWEAVEKPKPKRKAAAKRKGKAPAPPEPSAEPGSAENPIVVETAPTEGDS